MVPNVVPNVVKNKKIGKRKFLICDKCEKEFRSDYLFKHQKAHEKIRIRLVNGQF